MQNKENTTVDRIKMTQKEFEEFYEIDNEGITEEIEDKTSIPDKQDTTPEFLTEEETEHDNNLKEALNWNEEEEK